jgi:signal transduction histidine kinase
VREFTMGGARYLGSTLPLPDARGGAVGHLVAYRSLDEALRPARDLRLALAGIVIAAILVAFGSSYLLSQRVVRPVNRLLDETVRLGSGNLDRPSHPGRDDEIGKLAMGFEQMRVSLRRAQEELLRAERLSAVGRAASAIVHDFRQPVMVIQGYVALLKADLDDKAQCEEDLTLIESELARLNAMMGEILDYARGGEGIELTEGATADLLEEVCRPVRLLMEEKGIALKVEHGYTGHWRLDFPRTRRVLENLVRNAASVVKPGGSVCVRSEETAEGLQLVVEDTGPGIPEEIRENLFEPFVTHGKMEGTGLGLAIVKAFTERQGGSVRFETSPAGTRFLLDFPARGAA